MIPTYMPKVKKDFFPKRIFFVEIYGFIKKEKDSKK
jgi:hypothetical protein